MYGDPALPPDFVSLPYANPDAPRGGTVVFANTGGFDSLNPFIQKGTVPWQSRFWGYESLMGRSWDEPFTLYGLLAESVTVPEDRSWVEFTLRPEAAFSDGSPVTIEDVIWSYETLGTQGHQRYRSFWTQVESIEATGPRSVRLTFASDNRELALIAGMRPILKKAQFEGRDFTTSGLHEIPIGTAPYVVTDYEAGRSVTYTRNPDYWGNDIGFRRGTNNFDEMRIEFFGDGVAAFEAFKAGEISAVREYNAEQWNTAYDFPAVQRGDVVKSEIHDQKPTGMTGLVMNTRKPFFDDWRVRDAMIHAFNFEFINEAITGAAQDRITSYFDNSILAKRPGPATGQVKAYLEAWAGDLPPGALEGYDLPVSDGSERNRANIRVALKQLQDAGYTVEGGKLTGPEGPVTFEILLQQADRETRTAVDMFLPALERLGIDARVTVIDDAQYTERMLNFDFDMTAFRRALSLSPGNEQKLYWGSEGRDTPGSRNMMGLASPAVDGLIDRMLSVTESEDFTAAVRALDRVLTAERLVIPIWRYDVSRIAHVKEMHYPEQLPIYGDGPEYMPQMWWYEE
ncbi:ABC transporter substrate-binding protein [Marinibacterium profundimaris]|uniref:ABC transporter substrate-binding protein n=2 Tax=Marinibacterium profundimaris TaxID=1679460 RepID=A0A225NRB2_9RHOB|nr:extracellular solute-binding protein [Marinibacterium profundimaris]OWU77403.1 ABC transporter substrate-binding protein [Marinibacterium profundimaris]